MTEKCPTCGHAIKDENDELVRVITVRMPESLHQEIKNLAHDQKTSVNKLVVESLKELIALDP